MGQQKLFLDEMEEDFTSDEDFEMPLNTQKKNEIRDEIININTKFAIKPEDNVQLR